MCIVCQLPDCEKVEHAQALTLYSYSYVPVFRSWPVGVEKVYPRRTFFVLDPNGIYFRSDMQTSFGTPRSVFLRCAMGMTANLVIPIGGCGVPEATQAKRREGKGQRGASLCADFSDRQHQSGVYHGRVGGDSVLCLETPFVNREEGYPAPHQINLGAKRKPVSAFLGW